MIGKSVINGVKDTFTLSRTPWANVCETTKVMKGPGENPDDKPSIIPADKYAHIILQL